MTSAEIRRSLSLAVAVGVLGAAVLVFSISFFTPGKFILIPWALVVVGTLLAVRAERIPRFGLRFVAAFGSFMLPSAALYVFVGLSPEVAELGVVGHIWRLLSLALIGAAIGLATARIAAPPAALEARATT
jgi:hypothetical protein